MSIQRLLEAVPAERRAQFTARAAELSRRAAANQASPTELALALGVLSVLCGAGGPPAPGEGS